jgi:rare lipoprotein A
VVLKTAQLRIASGLKWCAISVVCIATASCSSTVSTPKQTEAPKKRSKEYFAESVYGVKASPRVVEGEVVPKGGGRFMVGNSYTIKGRRYQPREEAGYDKSGLASWYGDAFHGRRTANGEIYDKQHLSAAHPTMPLPSYARITNVKNGASVLVRVNDRGPFHAGRLIDVSSKTADLLDFKRAGTGNVRVQYVGRAPLEGDDTPYLLASYKPMGGSAPADNQRGWLGSMIASVRGAPASEQPAPAAQAPQVMMASAAHVVADILAYAVPVPMQRDGQISHGYPTQQSVQVALAPQPQILGQQAINASFGAPVAINDFPSLPEFGPFVTLRPDSHYLQLPGSTYAAAYAGEAGAVTRAKAAFDHVLNGQVSLTEKAIVEYAKRKGKAAR